MSRTHINILVQLARIDGVVVQDEIDLISKIAREKGMTSAEISESFEDPSLVEDLDKLSDDEKFEYIYSIVQLMKIDGRLYKEEIRFCSDLVKKLGYREEVLQELILKIYSDPHISTDKKSLKPSVQEFLIK